MAINPLAALSGAGQIWKLARKFEDLLELQTKTTTALANVDARLRVLEDRMIRLEAEQGQIITEAKAAAGAASTAIAGAVISDIVTRVTRLEMKQEDAQRRLSGPSDPTS